MFEAALKAISIICDLIPTNDGDEDENPVPEVEYPEITLVPTPNTQVFACSEDDDEVDLFYGTSF